MDTAVDNHINKVPLKEEAIIAKKIIDKMEVAFKNSIVHIKLNEKIEMEYLTSITTDMVKSLFRNKGAMACMAVFGKVENRFFNHCVKVSILAVTLGKQIGLSQADMINLGVGGLLHDIGKLRIPGHILNKPGKLTPEEFEIAKEHVHHTKEILDMNKDIPDEVYQIALEHHEKCDGSGYPAGLKEESISIFGKIGAIADAYDAITSKNTYHNERHPSDVLKFLYSHLAKTLFKPYLEQLIQCVGIYPIGSCVRLNTNETGIVISAHKGNLLYPRVKIILNRHEIQIHENKVIDLAKKKFDGSYKRYVTKMLTNTDLQLSSQSYLDML